MGTLSTETTFQQTRYTDSEWTSAYSAMIIKEGEFAITTDVFYSGTNCMKFKVGDGQTEWGNLDYYPFSGGTWGSITGTLSDQTDLWTALTTSTAPWLNVIKYQNFS